MQWKKVPEQRVVKQNGSAWPRDCVLDLTCKRLKNNVPGRRYLILAAISILILQAEIHEHPFVVLV